MVVSIFLILFHFLMPKILEHLQPLPFFSQTQSLRPQNQLHSLTQTYIKVSSTEISTQSIFDQNLEGYFVLLKFTTMPVNKAFIQIYA